MCRAGGRRCPSYSDPEKIAERNARRRAAYALSKGKKSKDKVKPADLKQNEPNFATQENYDLAKQFAEEDALFGPSPTTKKKAVKSTKAAAPKKKTTPIPKVKVPKTSSIEDANTANGPKVWTDEEMDKSLQAHLANEEAKKKEAELAKKLAGEVPAKKKKTDNAKTNAAAGPSEILTVSEAKKTTKTNNIFKTRSKVELDDGKYGAKDLLYSTGAQEYNTNLNIDAKENGGKLVDMGYFSKKTLSGVLDYTKLNEHSEEELGFRKIEQGKLYDATKVDENLSMKDYKKLGEMEVKNMTDDDQRALRYFTSNNYSWVNDALFTKKVSGVSKYDDPLPENASLTESIGSYQHNNEVLKTISKHLDEALTKGPKQQRVLYRGIRSSASFFKNKDGDHISAGEWVDDNLEVGKEIVFDGYQSSSPKMSGASSYMGNGGMLYEIVTPEGVNVESITHFEGEEEVTLPRNARYTVVGIHKNVDVKASEYSTLKDNVVVRLMAINSKGEILDGTNSDPVESLTDDYFKEIY